MRSSLDELFGAAHVSADPEEQVGVRNEGGRHLGDGGLVARDFVYVGCSVQGGQLAMDLCVGEQVML